MNPVECVPFPFYLPQLSVVLSLSAYCMGCHTAAAAAAAGRARVGRGENAWLQCPLVAADGTCVDKTLENCTIELLQADQPKVVVIISILVLS